MISVGCPKKVTVTERQKEVREFHVGIRRKNVPGRQKPKIFPGILGQGGETDDWCGLSLVIERVRAYTREVRRPGIRLEIGWLSPTGWGWRIIADF